MHEITSEMISLGQLLLDDNKQFYIPEFQRDFVWKDEQTKELINDLNEN